LVRDEYAAFLLGLRELFGSIGRLWVVQLCTLIQISLQIPGTDESEVENAFAWLGAEADEGASGGEPADAGDVGAAESSRASGPTMSRDDRALPNSLICRRWCNTGFGGRFAKSQTKNQHWPVRSHARRGSAGTPGLVLRWDVSAPGCPLGVAAM
jgi:hypothetical protein